jgi:hypothetical protein
MAVDAIFRYTKMIPLAAILSIGEKVLDKFVPDPEAKAKAIFELKRMEQDAGWLNLMQTTLRPRS